MKFKGKLILTAVTMVLFLAFIWIVQNVNVAQVYPDVPPIGLSTLNAGVHDTFGVNMTLYEITDVLGYVALALVGVFAMVGFVQLLKRKSLWAVDHCILALGVLYLITLGSYAFFEKVVVNCRPIIMEGELAAEASFPSSHTVLICVVMGSAYMVLRRYVKRKSLLTTLKILCCAVMLITVVGRIVCGAHWFSDIIAGLLLATSLLSAFSAADEKLYPEEK